MGSTLEPSKPSFSRCRPCTTRRYCWRRIRPSSSASPDSIRSSALPRHRRAPQISSEATIIPASSTGRAKSTSERYSPAEYSARLRCMPTDLVLLTADKNIEHGLRGLLSRPKALGIRAVTSKIYVHSQRDPACARKAHEFLRQFADDYQHALVVFDHEGCGREERAPAQLEEDVRQQLAANGWEHRAQAVVIAPELEAWVFSASPHVETCLEWAGPVRLRNWLQDKGFWPEEQAKPVDPKAALEA